MTLNQARLSYTSRTTHPHVPGRALARSSRLMQRAYSRVSRAQWQGAIYYFRRALAAQPSNLEAPLAEVAIDGCERAIAAKEAIDEAIAAGLPTEDLIQPKIAYRQVFVERMDEIPPGALA